MVKKNPITLFDLLNMFFLTLLGLTTLYPFIYLFSISVSPVAEVMKSSFILLPKGFTLENYQYVFKAIGIGDSYLFTIELTILGTAVNLLMSAMGAYVLAQKELPGKSFFTSMVIISMLFAGGIIPLYILVRGLGLMDKIWALILPVAINSFWMFILRNFFKSIPESLSDSARIDGCSEFRILFNIILPLSMPAIATLTLFYGVSHWNTYFTAVIYITDTHKMPLQVLIRRMFDQALQTELLDDMTIPPPVMTIRAATIIAATLPILCVYPFLQKYFMKGMMVGALKG